MPRRMRSGFGRLRRNVDSMRHQIISTTDFDELLSSLIGSTIESAENSYGSAIHLKLAARDSRVGSQVKGCQPQSESAVSVNFYWDWRLESGTRILCGSSNRRGEIKQELQSLVGLSVSEFVLDPFVPDLTVVVSNGLRLRSMALVRGDAQWLIKLQDGSSLMAKDGRMVLTEDHICEDWHPDPKADYEAQLSVVANHRWSARKVVSAKGRCNDCSFFIPLDAGVAFLWYGACACSESSKDGCVVHQQAGCDSFSRIQSEQTE